MKKRPMVKFYFKDHRAKEHKFGYKNFGFSRSRGPCPFAKVKFGTNIGSWETWEDFARMAHRYGIDDLEPYMKEVPQWVFDFCPGDQG